MESRLRREVGIGEQQCGFMPKKSTIETILALRILMEKFREGQRELHCAIIDLEKACDRVMRDELRHCMRQSEVTEKYVEVARNMYTECKTAVRSAVGTTDEFGMEVGLHQGSALSPFLFAMIMDRMTDDIRLKSPLNMMFADDIVICNESREGMGRELEKWRTALEGRGMKVSRSKLSTRVSAGRGERDYQDAGGGDSASERLQIPRSDTAEQ